MNEIKVFVNFFQRPVPGWYVNLTVIPFEDLTLIMDWVDQHFKGSYLYDHFKLIIHDERDATAFILKWAWK